MPKQERSVAAIAYPDKIIIEIRNKLDEYTWYSTADPVLLPVDISDAGLGKAVIDGLQRSEEKKISYDEIRQLREQYRRNAKFRSEKATLDKARYVSIYGQNEKMRFEPKANKTSKHAFYNLPDAIFELKKDANDPATVGKQVRNAWTACGFTS